eukprot:1513746-Rhodomonas_salina.2
MWRENQYWILYYETFSTAKRTRYKLSYNVASRPFFTHHAEDAVLLPSPVLPYFLWFGLLDRVFMSLVFLSHVLCCFCPCRLQPTNRVPILNPSVLRLGGLRLGCPTKQIAGSKFTGTQLCSRNSAIGKPLTCCPCGFLSTRSRLMPVDCARQEHEVFAHPPPNTRHTHPSQQAYRLIVIRTVSC